MEPTGNRDMAMAAFRDRAMRRSSIPVPGVPPAPGGGAPTPSPAGAPGGGQPQSKDINILKQVTGKVTEPEMIEVLIRRLKKLMPKEGEGGAANVTA